MNKLNLEHLVCALWKDKWFTTCFMTCEMGSLFEEVGGGGGVSQSYFDTMAMQTVTLLLL